MELVRLDKISLSFGTQVLFDMIDLSLKKGDKVGLLGRNGTGKTTLMKIIAGTISADSGEFWLRQGAEVAWLEQSLPNTDNKTVYEVVATGFSEIGELLSRYHHLISNYHQDNSTELSEIQSQLDSRQGWSIDQKIDSIISQLGLPKNQMMSELSGGWRKRVAIARTLVREPALLLLDEPTNHLDIPTIEWLEKKLQEYNGTILTITHDRRFLQNISNTIIELDRGNLYQFEGSFEKFLYFKDKQLEDQEKANKLFDKKLAQEEVWIRQGIRARRTRNEGRVRALETMRNERSDRRDIIGDSSFKINNADNSGKIVVDLTDVTHGFNNSVVVNKFSTRIQRGDRIGIVGSNGAGKSTLVKILLGKIQPDTGDVKFGSKLEFAYFDQLREHLDLEKNLIDNICGGQEFVEINGIKKHSISYLNDFLFTPERTRTPAKALSGGEQSRAILAKLFTQPANVLVLDEPTNDLDMETLELLEELLIKFNGTVILVSHDRQFMDNVVTNLMVFEGNGMVEEYVGSYSNWLEAGGKMIPFEDNITTSFDTKGKSNKSSSRTKDLDKVIRRKNKKLSYKEKFELEQQPLLIEKFESQIAKLDRVTSSPGFYDQDIEKVKQILSEITQLQSLVSIAYKRWDELEKIKNLSNSAD